jgi:serralysin
MAANNPNHFCICISNESQHENSRAALLNAARWQSGDVIRMKFLEGDQALRDRVQRTAERWTGWANVTFEFVPDDAPADVRIAFQQGDGSWSVLGTQCQGVPADQATMNYGWLTVDTDDAEVTRVVMHEMGHALGLIHEHQNPKGGIKWNEPAVIKDLSGPPNNWDEATIRHNVLDHYDPNAVTPTDVDPKSIMMYPIPASWTLDGFSAGMNDDVSQTDIDFIRQVYS